VLNGSRSDSWERIYRLEVNWMVAPIFIGEESPNSAGQGVPCKRKGSDPTESGTETRYR
jgi:hypothetical protein